MRKSTFTFAMAALLAVGACASPEVVVTVEIDVPDTDGEGMVTRPLGDVEVRLLPYDRDAVFDSMATAYGTPEPEVPQALMEAREEVRLAQEEWQAAEQRWNSIRDTLQKITSAMEEYSRGEARYVALFREFQDFDGQLGSVERQMNRAFEHFNDLQTGTLRAADSVRILQDNWADEAFSGVGEVFLAMERGVGLESAADTTDSNGIAREFHINAKLKPGRYWVNARYELTYTELYWNVPIDVVAGEPVQIRLTSDNAEERIKL